MAERTPDGLPRATEDQRRALGVVLGVTVAAGLALVDARLGGEDIVIGTVVLGPLLCALLGTARDAAVVSVVATTLAAVSGFWNDNFDSGPYFLRLAVVALGGVIATLASARGQTIARDRSRFAVLAGIAGVADGTLTLEETAARVNGLIVPAVADLCIVDVLQRGELRRLTVRVRGPHASATEAAVRARAPTQRGTLGSAEAIATSTAQLVD